MPTIKINRDWVKSSVVLILSLVFITSSFCYASSVEVVQGENGEVNGWLVIGPYSIRDDHLEIDEKFNTFLIELKKDPLLLSTYNLPWKIISSKTDWIDLGKRLLSKNNIYSVAITYIESLIPQKGYIIMGSDDGFELWLNGTKIFSKIEPMSARKDSFIIPVELSKGLNIVILKIYQYWGRWGFYFRLVDSHFLPLKNGTFFLPVLQKESDLWKLFLDSLDLDLIIKVEEDGIVVYPSITRNYGGVKFKKDIKIKLVVKRKGEDKTFFEENWNYIESSLYEPKKIVLKKGTYLLSLYLNQDIVLEKEYYFNPLFYPILKQLKRNIESYLEASMTKLSLIDTLNYRYNILEEKINQGENNPEYILSELDKLRAFVKKPENLLREKGVVLKAYRSKLDESLQPYLVYVPLEYDFKRSNKKYPLVVALHGLNGRLENMIKVVTGVSKNPEELNLPLFIVLPYGYGNSNYRLMGEVDVLRVIEEVVNYYPIDRERIYITGISMGGTGSLSLALKYPDLFAATAPLCGYHDLFLYNSVKQFEGEINGWERFLLQSMSNRFWVENGKYLPVYLIHGRKDRPEYSRTIVDGYTKLGYEVEYYEPVLGHNVWEWGYRNLKILNWLKKKTRPRFPKKIRFKTASLRYNKSYWIEILSQEKYGEWSEIEGELVGSKELYIRTENVYSFAIDFTKMGLFSSSGISVIINQGQKLDFSPPWEKYIFYKVDNREFTWDNKLPKELLKGKKRPNLSGPILDIYHYPLKVIYGGRGGEETTMLFRYVAERLAHSFRGVNIRYPVASYFEVKEEELKNYHLILVGTPESNPLIGEVVKNSPFEIKKGGIYINKGERLIEGECLGLSFIYPSPFNPNNYVVVHTGNCMEAPLWSLSLPQLLPDWIIYDRSSIQLRYGLTFEGNKVIGGFFNGDWKIVE